MRFDKKELELIDRMVAHYPQFIDILTLKSIEETNVLVDVGGDVQRGRCQMLKEIIQQLDEATRPAKRTVTQPFSQ